MRTSVKEGWRVRTRLSAILAAAGAALFVLPSVSLAQSNPIVLENQQPGSGAWEINTDKAGQDAVGQIKGYASATSVNKGEDITFYVTTNPPQTFSFDLFRIGWYQGLGGRLVQHVGPLNGTTQPTCPMDPTSGMIECHWTPSYTLTTAASWTSGVYLVLMTNQQGYQNYIVFVLRDDNRVAALLYQQGVNTYQAYNNYPNDNKTGKSLYDFNSYGPTMASTGYKSAAKVSFDRPYLDNGIDWGFFSDYGEVNFIRWIERSGYDVTYSTDVDTHATGSRLLRYRGFLSVGHDEYWSKQMYDAAEIARNAGVNLGFFGANAVYWQVRFEPSSSGVPDRVVVCYKDADKDPITDLSLKTVMWRDPPVNRAEQQLIGVQYTSMVPYNNGNWVTHVVTNSGNWVYGGTSLQDGDTIPVIVGYEADRYFSEYPGPDAVPGTYTLLSHCPYQSAQGPDYSSASIYQAPSGAWVFGTGSMNWNWGLDEYQHGYGVADARVQRATANVLDRFVASGQRDFQLGVSPAAQTITPGGAAVYNITVNPSAGFSDPVALSVSGLPGGAIATFSPNPATSTATLSLTTSTTTPLGTYPLTVTGVSASLQHNVSASLAVLVPDFSLTASPASQTVAVGNSATYAVAVSPVGSFSDPVTLSVSGLPAGVSASFSPNPTTGLTTLSLTTSAATPTGSFTLTIFGTSGSLTHSATATLATVVPDFALAASPSSRSIATGGSTSYSLTIMGSGGFTGAVNLSVGGLPTGASATFSPNPSSGTSTLSIATSSVTPGGTYALTITGVSGSITHTASVSLTISSGVTVTAPNTAVSWRATSTQNITFTHNLGVGQAVNVDLSRDGGANYSPITVLTTTSASTGTYSWKVTGPPTTQARVRVTSATNPAATDMSDVNFTIVNPVVTVTSPNTAISWRAGDTKNVTFSHTMGVGQQVRIDVSRDSGTSWSPVATYTTTSATSGTFPWVVSGPPTSHARIRVSWVIDPTVTDTSDVDFTILPRTTVTAPNTAVTWGAGSTRTVTWTHNLGVGGPVNIDFSPDNGATWVSLATGVPSNAATTGTANVQMPPTVTTQALVRVVPTVDPASGDTSDVAFTLATPTITVTAPNTNVTWGIGSTKSIKWSHNLGVLESVKIELSRDGVNYVEVVAPSVANSASSSGTYGWVVTGPATTQGSIRVTWVRNPSVSDISNFAFKIQ
jgi:hypothetical protein